MAGFNEAWSTVAGSHDGEPVSLTLRPLLEAVYLQSISQPFNPREFKKSLENLLEFLSDEGRTNANCWAVDLFFAHAAGWERDWAQQDLPDDFHNILAKMGEALHDTVRAPDFARDYGCLPEQLLERVRRLPV